MKVAYNNCFGGFGLSNVALTAFAKSKNIDLIWYKQIGYRHSGDERYARVKGVPTGDSMSFIPLTVDSGETIDEIPSDSFYYPDFYDNEVRCDNDLINIIESLGDKANGTCANLSIAEIPDGVDFEITDYDGIEKVVPPRSSW